MSANRTLSKQGGGFLLEGAKPEEVFTPEDFTEEHRMIAEMTADFVEGEVLPHDEKLEHQDFELTVRLLRKGGELGLLGSAVPEAYGGTDLDKISSTLITEHLVRAGSFSLSHGAHVGIGSLPIVLFGTEEQKARYLPDLASGARLAAYCLTEPSSGSDALGAKTTAVLSEDGSHYVLNGTKQFITNAAFADVYIVYAKADGDKFTAFIVEREYEGVSTGPEEKKMGIKGSSTRPLILEDARVPVENVLGEIGRGHVIAFNILNIGRYSLAAGCVGTAKWALELAAQYAKERKQFGKPLSAFPLIQNKLASVAARTYAAESMVYRTGGLIDEGMAGLDKNAPDYSRRIAKAVEEYALECSVNKVFATEALDFAADEGVQIHGGYGYIQEYRIERIYRDSRINRIFEGTNEINRLLIPGTLFRRALKGELPFMEAAQQLQQDLIAYMPPTDTGEPMFKEAAMVEAARLMFLMAGGTAAQTYGVKLEEQQELLAALADLVIAVYAMESAVLRAKKAYQTVGEQGSAQKRLLASIFVHEAFANAEQTAKTALLAMGEGDSLRMQLSILKKLARFEGVNLFALKRQAAAPILAAGRYTL